MANKMYVGVSGIAQQIQKAYVGVGGVARKVKKAYVGVRGIAQLCYMASSLGNLPLGSLVYFYFGTSNKPFILVGKGNHGANTVTLMNRDYLGSSLYGPYRTAAAQPYEGSALDNALNGTFKAKFSAAHLALLINAPIQCYTAANGIYTIYRQCFALSEMEIGYNAATKAEGTRCEYFDLADANANAKRDSFLDGTSKAAWNTRTASASNVSQVNSSGYMGTQSQTGTALFRAAIVVSAGQGVSEVPDGNGVYSLV